MTAKVLPPASGGSFLDSPVFIHAMIQSSPGAFSATDVSPPLTKLFFDSCDTEEVVPTTGAVTSQPNTPDSGFCGAALSTPLKSPDTELCRHVDTPPSSTNTGRKRKTVTINESQPTVVVISPDDLFKAYSRPLSKRQVLQHEIWDTELDLAGDMELADISDIIQCHLDSITGWPIKRSESLESRDNPFIPGGELSLEAEDLLSRATIIRDHFYLNEHEKRALREQQQRQQRLQQQRVVGHIHTEDSIDGLAHCDTTCPQQPCSPGVSLVIEENLLLQSSSSPLLAAASPTGDRRPKENGQAADWPRAITHSRPHEDNLPAGTACEGDTVHICEDLQVHDSNTKQRNKCCSMM